tara:strand:- start:12963 stop:13139 length:177 start_codon:yes stop_codon:yes gene_type:complete
MTITLETNGKPFLEEGLLKTAKLKEINFRALSLVSNKKKAPNKITDNLLSSLLKSLGE